MSPDSLPFCQSVVRDLEITISEVSCNHNFKNNGNEHQFGLSSLTTSDSAVRLGH